MQPAAQMRERVERAQALHDLGSGGLVLQCPGVVEDITTLAQIAGVARRPEFLVSHAPEQASEDRVTAVGVIGKAYSVGDHAAQIEIDHSDSCSSCVQGRGSRCGVQSVIAQLLA